MQLENNATNVNKTNNYLSPQIIEHKNNDIYVYMEVHVVA
jgi:hypothetical protein